MATTTPNFGWSVPTSTDLVKDGATAIETLGDAIDASLVDLKGGTTGQVLSKNSNTDMDFTWIANDVGDITAVTAGTGISGGGTSGAVTITNSMATAIDAKGDLVAGTGADAFSRLAVGSNDQVLTADSTAATGLKWATLSSSGKSWTLLNSGGTALTGAATITVSGISGQESLLIAIQTASSVNTASFIKIRFNGNSANDYITHGFTDEIANTYAATNFGAGANSPTGLDAITIARMSGDAASSVSGIVQIDGCKGTGMKSYTAFGAGSAGSSSFATTAFQGGIYEELAAITSVSILSSTGNFDAGTIYIYGSAN